jgi:formate--tetrahydrofolate ligase
MEKHIRNIREHYGLPCIVSINHFVADTQDELDVVMHRCSELGIEAHVSTHWAQGGAGAESLARAVVKQLEQPHDGHRYVYSDEDSLWTKIEKIATRIYGAASISADPKVRAQLAGWEEAYGRYPICMAKTQMSFSTDPEAKGAPEGHNIHIREVRLANGAGFIVAIAGDIMTMPGLPKVPAAESIDIDAEGRISGLF